MSLIGHLEDLGLEDLLQLLGLSQKSGVLSLRTKDGDGRIVFRAGLVCSAVARSAAGELHGLPGGGGPDTETDFDGVGQAACERVGALSEDLIESEQVGSERIDSLRREAVEAAMIRMLRWRRGDFRFEFRDSSEFADHAPMLATGLNAQYLAIESTRRADEEGARAACDGRLDEPRDALDAVVEAVLEEPGSSPENETLSPVVGTASRVVAVDAFTAGRPVIVIDPDRSVIEWARRVLARQCERIHVFQRADHALARIRQYLARAVAPIVLLSPVTPGDRLSGIADAADFVQRLKRQAPLMQIVWLEEDGVVAVAEPGSADATATRPAAHQLHAGVGREPSDRLAQSLRDLVGRLASDGDAPRVGPQISGEAFEALSRATSCLGQATRRGEVLAAVLDSAARVLGRAALLAVGDGTAVGLAQRRLTACGGPADDGLRRVRMRVADSRWLTRVVAERAAIRTAPDGAGDLRLAAALGDRPARQAYLAPIESCGRIDVILYGDDLPGEPVPSDTRGLEVLLHQAGLALDRIALERAADRDSA